MTRDELFTTYQNNDGTLKAIAAHFVGRTEFGLDTALERLTLEILVHGGIVRVDEENDGEIVWKN